MSQKLSWVLLFALLGSVTFSGCADEDPQDNNSSTNQSNNNNEDKNDDSSQSISNETYYANMFGKDALETYYLWNEEIRDDLNQWIIETNNDPIGTFDRIRYHEGEKYIDKWSMLTNDMASFENEVNGTVTTFGWSLSLYDISSSEGEERYVGVVNYVYKDSPAAKAGLKRGDILLTLDGKIINSSNYLNLYNSSTLTVTLGLLESDNYIHDQNKEVSLTAVSMYENPIICDSIYEFNGKKVGYLAYTSFDLASIPQLIDISRKFKSEQIKELVLDLRYNGGGYVTTEQVLASLFAPQSAVTNKEVFEKEVYNKALTQYYQQEGMDLESRFETDFEYQDQNQTVKVSTKDANIGLEKVYGLISSGSASASEALLGGLMPYTQIKLIGSQSHGKYCTGALLPAKDFYVKTPAELNNWGAYVMISIYQNALGETPCMPDGLTPDIKIEDDPLLPYVIGDVNEPLLKQALIEAGRTYDEGTTSASLSRSMVSQFRKLPQVESATFGKRILTLPSKATHNISFKTEPQ